MNKSMKTIAIPVDDEFHRKIKVYCAENGITMKDLFIAAVEKGSGIKMTESEKEDMDFTIIEDEAKFPKFDPETGEIVEE